MQNLLNSGALVAPTVPVAIATPRPVSSGPHFSVRSHTVKGIRAHTVTTRSRELANRFYSAALNMDDAPLEDEVDGTRFVYFYGSDEECAQVVANATGVPA